MREIISTLADDVGIISIIFCCEVKIMAHLALYRTYRPKDFDSVVGQKHIVQTMRNQIYHDLLAHAHMFTGPRGTGKTSIARIVAKAINCKHPENGNPCSTCESCLAIASGNHPDVFELDGASNNGVDEIRDIRDRVKYSPSLSAYKVYIIDEVHMLSTGAFNALLKTLEEPPAHVIFMLATTEIHKVPDTILSRVQRFDLKQIPSGEMTDHLKRILQDVEVEFEAGVPELIANLASGGLRDALSMLDQAIAYKTDVMRLTDIHDLNGSVDIGELVEIVNSIIEADFAGIAEATRKLLASGKLPARVIDGLLALLRDVLKVQKIGGDDDSGLAQKLTSQQILTFIKQLNSLAHELKIATDAELILEVGLIELGFVETEAPAATPSAISGYGKEIEDLTKQIHQLQREVAALKTGKSSASPAKKEISMTGEPAGFGQSISEFPVFVQGELVNGGDFNEGANLSEPHFPEADHLDVRVEETKKELLIEDILTGATKNDKGILQQKVTSANAFAKLDIKEIVMLLKDAEIAAATAEACILVYDYETTAQKLLTDENRQKACEILTDMMARPYSFIALPKAFWLTQRASYVAQKKQGEMPKLEQYTLQTKGVISEPSPVEEEVPFYQEVVDMFGDMVEVVE